MLTGILPDKEILKSWTAWGALLFGFGKTAEGSGFLAEGLTDAIVAVCEPLSAVLVIMGFRRAIGAAGVPQKP